MNQAKAKEYQLLYNSRFYILVGSFLLSIFLFALLRLQIPSDQLFYIRAQQVFGLLSILYWYVALIISPLGYVIGKHRMVRLEFARRGIGVSAFYFALLHGSIALWKQLGGPEQLQYLPSLSRWSILGGFIAFVVLFMMATTSLDKVIDFMTYKRWKWLHRLGYIGGTLVVLHIWSIGTHLAYGSIQLAAFLLLTLLSGLELFRITKNVNQKYLHFNKAEVAALFVSAWILVITAILLMPTYINNYHQKHVDGTHVTELHESGGL